MTSKAGHFILGIFSLIIFSFSLRAQNRSVLSEGTWTKIAITQTGVYQINTEWLRKNNINPDRIKPQQVEIFQGHRGVLPQSTNNPRSVDLTPVETLFLGEENDIWDESDILCFFAESPHITEWNKIEKKWMTSNHPYTDTAYYFIRWNNPIRTRIQATNWEASQEPKLDYAWSHFHYQPEISNVIQSGRNWLGDAFYGNSEKIIQYPIRNYKEGKPAQLFGQLASSSVKPGVFSFNIENNTLPAKEIASVSGDRYDQKVQVIEFSQWVNPLIKNDQWSWKLNYSNSVGTGYLNNLSFNYPRLLNASNENPLYYFTNSQDSSFTISIQNLSKQHQVWLKNGENAWRSLSNQTSIGKINCMPGSKLLVFDPNKLTSPSFAQTISNQDIKQISTTELIIICSPALKSAADKLAEYKNKQAQISTAVISTDQIYHQYSGGKQDITAIRDFLFDQKNRPNALLKYVLILGDATVDYKNKNSVASPVEKVSYVPTYESRESYHPLLSYASDDYFGFLAPGQGEWQEGESPINENLSIGVGRIPARNLSEALMLVNKLIDYSEKQKLAPAKLYPFVWVADDGDFNLHVQDAEDFSSNLAGTNPVFQQGKIYVDQFPMELNNGIYTSSATKKQVKNAWDSQGDFIHYIGHGAETVWADEKIWTTEDIQKLNNSQHLPWVLTATCQFGRFDDPNVLSGAELSLVSDKGGAIGLISTSRPVFQSSNYVFGRAFYRLIQEHAHDLNYRMGDLFRDTKNQSHAGVINRNITLLGDPSMAVPWNYQSLPLAIDSLKLGLEKPIELAVPDVLSEVTLFLQGPKMAQKTLGTKTNTYSYEKEGDIFWKAKLSNKQGRITLPLNSIPSIYSTPQTVTIKLVAKDAKGKTWAAAKSIQWIPNNTPIIDNQAPQIKISLVNESNIQATSPDPILEIELKDDRGFLWQKGVENVSYILVNDTLKIPLLDYFNPTNDQNNEGKVLYSFRNLPPGEYKIQVKCVDIDNKPNESTFRFQVSKENLSSNYLLVYPNPFLNQVHFRLIQEKFWSDNEYHLKIISLLGQTILEKSGNLLGSADESVDLTVTFQDAELTNLGMGAYYELELKDKDGSDLRKYKGKILTLK